MQQTARQQVTLDQRRARLARQHRLAPDEHAPDVGELTDSLIALHSTDPATVYLSAWARIDGFATADLDHALYVDRSLVKHLAMRRTLFVFGRDALADAQTGASQRVAATEARRLIKDVEQAGLYDDGEGWLETVRTLVPQALADGRQATSTELREEIAELRGATTYGAGRSWGGEVPIGPRALTVLSAEGRIVRGPNRGDWATSRPRWSSMDAWLGEPLRPTRDGHTAMVERWLRSFGPGTVNDLKWWLGSTITAVKKSLQALDVAEVELDSGTGYLMADDADPVEAAEPWVALLPALDPTIMGWADRDWYVSPEDRKLLFDRNGNAGPTVWSDGRVVGGWWQNDQAEVQVHLLTDIGAEADAAVGAEATRLTEWLGGRRVLPRFPSPLSKELVQSIR